MDERVEKLGFKPQKENQYNKILPYSEDFDEESLAQLAEIKANLGRTFQLRDVKTGGCHWVNQLAKYIRIYGLKFSKEDHVNFIKILYHMITIPEMELSLVIKFSSVLVSLVKKKELLSRKDLELPWRPLHALFEHVYYTPYESYGLFVMPNGIDQALKNIVRSCRAYFSLDATQEMLDEWRPLLCPHDTAHQKAITYFELFLPTMIEPENTHRGYKLWFEELWSLYASTHNCPAWEGNLVILFTRLANQNIGYIDWNPKIPIIFTRILRNLHLQVGTSNIDYAITRQQVYDIGVCSLWIVAMMGKDSIVPEHLDKFWGALKSFYHPSNHSRSTSKLLQLMSKIAKSFVSRLHNERYRKVSWCNSFPEEHKITEDQITHFVNSMKDIVFMAMFSKLGSGESAVTLHHLALLRPEIVIPPLLEKLYPAMETLTEPHRLTASMMCLISVSRSMVSNTQHYPEGRLHILPILNLCLPGIDSNDFKKSLITLQLIASFATLITIVDCSEAVQVRSDLTEDEKELCSATAQFEDFILQFLDRVFAIIETSAREQSCRTASLVADRMSPQEAMLEMAISATVSSLFQQVSGPIFDTILNKIYRYVCTTVTEVRVAGRYIADLTRSLTRAYPDKAVPVFIPYFCDKVIQLTDSPDVQKEEHLDDELLYHMLLLSETVRCNGAHLLAYKNQLTTVLERTIHLSAKPGYELACSLIRHLLKALVLMYPLDYASVPLRMFNKSLTEYLPIRDWGKPGDINNLEMDFHIPSDAEVAYVAELVERFYMPVLEMLERYTQGEPTDRDVVLRTLTFMSHVVQGCSVVLPQMTGTSVKLVDSMVPLNRSHFKCGFENKAITINGIDVRLKTLDVIKKLVVHLQATCDDDSKSLYAICNVYQSILFFVGSQKEEFDPRWKSFHLIKKANANQLIGRKKHIRTVLVDRTQLQHEWRVIYRLEKTFNSSHLEIYKDLLTLSVSRYREVRTQAQSVLGKAFTHFTYSYKSVLSDILKGLKNDPDIPHHQFKGSLYLLKGTFDKRSLGAKKNWDTLNEVWPAIAQAQHSEKPSIQKLIDDLADKIHKHIESFAIRLDIPDSVTEVPLPMWSTTPTPSLPPASPEEIQQGLMKVEEKNAHWLKSYNRLCETLVGLVAGGTLQWKYSQLAVEFTALLIRYDVPLPASAVDMFIKNMVHDSINIRKLCVSNSTAIIKQLKRPHKKIKMDPYEYSKAPHPNDPRVATPGDRPDNMWRHYDSKTLPQTKEEWEAMPFVDKCHWGFYMWPYSGESFKLKVYAPPDQQPKLGRTREELSENERIIYDYFNNTEYLDKLIKMLSLEEQKGKDKFQVKNYALFKGIFRNYDDAFIPLFRPILERLVNDTKPETHECSHRCAAEIIAGIAKGAKHWDFDKTSTMWSWMIPLMANVMSTMTVESIADWGTCFATAAEERDPKRIHWMFELLMDNPLRGDGGSFGDSSRLYILQGALSQMEWHVPELLHGLLKYIKPYLSHPYKNVRDRLGSVLTTLFGYDHPMPNGNPTMSPQRAPFIKEILPMLEILMETKEENGVAKDENGAGSVIGAEASVSGSSLVSGSASGSSVASDTGAPSHPGAETDMEMDVMVDSPMEIEVTNNHVMNGDKDKRKIAIRLCKTVMMWIRGNLARILSNSPEEFRLLPIMAPLGSEINDDELRKESELATWCLSQSYVNPEDIPEVLKIVYQVAGLQSWHARSSILQFCQCLVFSNLFNFQTPHIKEQIKELVLHLLCDEQLEVREMAQVTLSGFLQCEFIEVDADLLDHFKMLSGTKIKKRKTLSESIAPANLIKRHAGVLGLSACVRAYPYDVPEFMPQILMLLSDHVNDPQPIQLTVNKTLSDFRRTHHDNWQDHKQQFTDDQLVVLTDLLVSPNYYA